MPLLTLCDPGSCARVGVSKPVGASVGPCCATPATTIASAPSAKTANEILLRNMGHLRNRFKWAKANLSTFFGNTFTQCRTVPLAPLFQAGCQKCIEATAHKKRETREFRGFPLLCCRISKLLIGRRRDTSE